MTRNKNINQEYFPLFNYQNLRSSITPFFSGDLKVGLNHYMLEPVSEIDLHKRNKTRNVIFNINGINYYLNGESEHQQNDKLSTKSEIGIYEVIRENPVFHLNTRSFISQKHPHESHIIEIKNNTSEDLTINITTEVPLYCRGAENIFDHRHVSSLFNRIKEYDNGIVVKPSLSFDEKGHKKNEYHYGFFSYLDNVGSKEVIPCLEDYIGSGSLKYPKRDANGKNKKDINGFEAIGCVVFDEFILKPADTKKLKMILIISNEEININEIDDYNNVIEDDLLHTRSFLKEKNNYINFLYKDKETSDFLKKVSYQPIYRMVFGNSFLPHHDYGKGGKGWRDLFQDLLTLMISGDKSIREQLINHVSGIRLDGSNATIIGEQKCEFKADRNNIVRVWSDHGCWPVLTFKGYINETKDLDILSEKQTYFNDQFTHYTKKHRGYHGNKAKDKSGNIINATILEHLLRQNVVGLLNAGEKGYTKLENADWNDALDMAKENGETIAFTHMYLANIRTLISWIKNLNDDIYLDETLMNLIKTKDINKFFDDTSEGLYNSAKVNGKNLIFLLETLTNDALINLDKAFINGYYKGYINNLGEFLELDDEMTLAGQAIPLMCGSVSKEKIKSIALNTREKLFKNDLGGYLLNTNFNGRNIHIGRAEGFAYGHKENGAMFSHMSIMYIYGLYNYDSVEHADEGLKSIINKSLNDSLNGIPEYFNTRGDGKYLYLTGSASWLIKTMREKVFGINMDFGELSLKPALKKEDFIDKKASIETYIGSNKVLLEYINNKDLDYNEYVISEIFVDGKKTVFPATLNNTGKIEVYLDEKI